MPVKLFPIRDADDNPVWRIIVDEGRLIWWKEGDSDIRWSRFSDIWECDDVFTVGFEVEAIGDNVFSEITVSDSTYRLTKDGMTVNVHLQYDPNVFSKSPKKSEGTLIITFQRVTPTAIETPTPNRISVSQIDNSTIEISGLTPSEKVEVFDVLGNRLCSEIAVDNTVIVRRLCEDRMYIVVAGEETVKIFLQNSNSRPTLR